MKQEERKALFAGLLLGLPSDPEDGSGTLLRNISELLLNNIALHPRREN
jgi:hypothetical protein